MNAIEALHMVALFFGTGGLTVWLAFASRKPIK
jgi:hypothetical protein